MEPPSISHACFGFLSFNGKQYTDSDFAETIDYLMANPNAITQMDLDGNQLTDVTGVKLAQYVAASFTIELMDLANNRFGEETYLAFAAALRVNTSLEDLFLEGNLEVDRARVDTAFIHASRLNFNLSFTSVWYLYSTESEFERLQTIACRLGHPTLQELLVDREISTEKHNSN